MAILFHTDLESGSSPWGFDSIRGGPDSAVTLDTTSKVQGANSLEVLGGASFGSAVIEKGLTTPLPDVYTKFKLFVPDSTGWAHTDSLLIAAFNYSQSTFDALVHVEFEKVDGLLTFTGNGPGRVSSGIQLDFNRVYDIEIRIKVGSGSSGRIQVWVDNGTEVSPDFDSGGINIGTDDIVTCQFGNPYFQNNYGPYYLDDFYIADSFIGAPPAELTQTRYRFRNDDGGENNATWKDSENENIEVLPNDRFRLRFQISEE